MGVVTITWQVPAPQPASISLGRVSFCLQGKGRGHEKQEPSEKRMATMPGTKKDGSGRSSHGSVGVQSPKS
jgi:hypothetical protein